LDELPLRMAERGFAFTQLAIAKALSEPGPLEGPLDRRLVEGIAKAFGAARIRIAVLGAYFNPVHPDPRERRRGVESFKALLEATGTLGCPIVATETGSLNADLSFHPDNRGEAAFAVLVDTLRELVGEAEKRGATACIEGVANHVIHSPARMRRILDELGSPNLGVILDPVNFLDGDNYRGSLELVEEALELFGDRILVVHAKDFVIEGGRPIRVPPGKGLLDFPKVFALIRERGIEPDIIIEDLRPEAMEEALRFLREASSC
jgi:sugar phosphate isomerase/epimerase